MPNLPARPSIDHLRHQAKDLLRAATAGDSAAAGRIRAVSDRLTLAAAQLALARDYGFASWARLKAEVEARAMDLAQKVDAFCETSIRDRGDRAARMLAATPEIAGYNFATAVILGEADRVRAMLDHDPELARRPDPRFGWPPLHAVCASQWHRIDPSRAAGMTEVARLLLDAGAPVGTTVLAPGRRGQSRAWSALFCAVAGTSNDLVIQLLLERGARPDDHTLYLAAFRPECLRLLLAYVRDIAESTALAAPISVGNLDGVRLLLEAGADPRRPLPGDLFGERIPAAPPIPTVAAAVEYRCPVELIGLLLEHGADPDAPGQDGRSPYRLAVRQGRAQVAHLLARHGAHDNATDVDRFLSACRQHDHAEAARLMRRDPDLPRRLTDADHAGSKPPNTDGPRRCASCWTSASRWTRGAWTVPPPCTPPPAPAAPRALRSFSTEAPTSKRATPPGTARRWCGRRWAVDWRTAPTPTRTGWPR